jgi:hypothetical protein
MKKESKNKQLLKMDPLDVYKMLLKGEISKFPTGFFISDGLVDYGVCNAIIKYLINDILNLKEEEIPLKVSVKTFSDYKLKGMLSNIFDGSPYKAINLAYPNRFNQWEFKNTSINFWNLENAKIATKWLIEEKLKWNDETLFSNLTMKVFFDNGLGGMLINFFGGSPYKAINNAYPEKYEPWQFEKTHNNYWNDETSSIAVKWLVEQKLKLAGEKICVITKRDFKENGLGGMLVNYFNGSVYAAINNAYPNKFKMVGKKIKTI